MKIAKACGLIPNDTTITTGDPIFMDVTKPPFRLYGLYEPFRRVPEKIAAATSDAVANLAAMTAGARLRFSTDSDYVVIHAEIEGAEKNPRRDGRRALRQAVQLPRFRQRVPAHVQNAAPLPGAGGGDPAPGV